MKKFVSSILAINMMCAGMPVHANGEVCVGDTCAQRTETQVVKSGSTEVVSGKNFNGNLENLKNYVYNGGKNVLDLVCGTYPWFCYDLVAIVDHVRDLSELKNTATDLFEWGKWCATHPGECWSARNEALEKRQDNYAFVRQEDGTAVDFLHWVVLGLFVYTFIPKWGKIARLKSSVRAMQGQFAKYNNLGNELTRVLAEGGKTATKYKKMRDIINLFNANNA